MLSDPEKCAGTIRLFAVLALITASACQPASRDDADPVTQSTSVNTDADETWDVIYLSGQSIGYQTTKWHHAEDNGDVFRDISYRSVLRMKRFGQPVEETIEINSRETSAGRLVSFSTAMSSGATPIRSTGQRAGRKLELSTQAGGQEQSWSLPLPDACGGPFAVEFSLMNEPMQPGESRSMTAVVPVLNIVAPIALEATDYEDTELLDGRQKLLKIVSLTSLPDGQSLRTVLWCDSSGQVVKASVPAMNQITYRVSREHALAGNSGSLDLAQASMIRIDPPLPSPHSTRKVQYLATLQEGDPSTVFIESPYQALQREDDRSAIITVTRVDPESDPPPEDLPPSDADRHPSAMIQSDDPLIRDLANSIRAPQDPWLAAVAVEKFVHGYVRAKDFSTAFATAADVARERSGDCTEHAVLTAAICRARGIPARVMVGLVYVSQLESFGFHMWNEVWVGDRWVPLDATLGRGGIGAAHLALNRTPLSTEDSFASFLPVVQVIGRLELEVVKAE